MLRLNTSIPHSDCNLMLTRSKTVLRRWVWCLREPRNRIKRLLLRCLLHALMSSRSAILLRILGLLSDTTIFLEFSLPPTQLESRFPFTSLAI